MTIRHILRIGNPLLRQVSVRVSKPGAPAVDALVRDMLDTMSDADGAGLAAVQIGVAERVMIFGFEANARYPDVAPIPLTVLINPEYEIIGDAIDGGWEGCLSVPGMRGYVERPARIHYRGQAPDGTLVEREAEGFHARVFQHEYDHLDGVLYPDRLADPRQFGFCEELEESGVL